MSSLFIISLRAGKIAIKILNRKLMIVLITHIPPFYNNSIK